MYSIFFKAFDILGGTAGETEVKTDGKAIAGFVCGLLSVFIAGIILGILGIVFSARALSRIGADKTRKGKGLAIAGLVLGIVGVVGAALVLAAM